MGKAIAAAELQELTRRQRLALCDQLDTLTAPQFEVDSLCDGWRIHDVVAHLVSIVTLPAYKFAAFTPSGLNRVFDKRARQLAHRDPRELVDAYRTNADQHMRFNPAGKYAELCDIATHSLDIARPLGLDAAVVTEAKPIVLDGLVNGSWLTRFGMQLFRARGFDDVALVATDVEWSHGKGPKVRGTANDLILGITGRAIDATDFDGNGASAWLTANPPAPPTTQPKA